MSIPLLCNVNLLKGHEKRVFGRIDCLFIEVDFLTTTSRISQCSVLPNKLSRKRGLSLNSVYAVE
jgi:hypothetical protein